MRAAKLLLLGGFILGGVIAVVLLQRSPSAAKPSAATVVGEPTATRLQEPVPAPSPAEDARSAGAEASALKPVGVVSDRPPTPAAPAAAASAKPPSKPSAPPRAPRPKKEILDPAARVVLSFVGIDPEAEAYWYAAINDPSLPPNERKDLIEDLNEDGLSDPRRPGPEDLPLIMSRLALIEEAAPFALDQVNADAFQEAYKDLANLVARLAQR